LPYGTWEGEHVEGEDQKGAGKNACQCQTIYVSKQAVLDQDETKYAENHDSA
jgi:hypothetical protein